MAQSFKIASRGSKLALWQSRHVATLLAALGIDTEIEVVKTEGDRIQDRFLHEIGGKGLFVRELELAMLEGRAQLAVHSTKDLPATIDERFVLGAVLPRQSPLDVMIFRSDVARKIFASDDLSLLTIEEFAKLPSLKIGTASLRRQALLKGQQLLPLRGNVDTRLKKLHDGMFDAIVLAHAVVQRLDWQNEATRCLDSTWFVPSPAQGAISVEVLRDSPLLEHLQSLDHRATRIAITTERQILSDLGGDCTMPIGCYCFETAEGIVVTTKVLNHAGDAVSGVSLVGRSWQDVDPIRASQTVLAELYGNGLQTILDDLASKAPNLGVIEP